MERTLSANLATTLSNDRALAALLAGAMGYDGHHPGGHPSLFAAQPQQPSDEELRQVRDLTPLVVVVLGSPRERLYSNQVGHDFLGTAYSQSLEDRPDADLLPDGLVPAQLEWNVAFANGLPFEFEVRSRRRDGTYRWLSLRLRSVRNEAEQVGRRPTVSADIDDCWRADQRLEERAASRAGIGLESDRLQRVLEYIAANLRSDLCLEKLAAIACYSTFHFARMFTLAVGVPPHRYIGRLRLENAMEELETGKLSLAEIALNAKFSSQASFTRAFRRATGTTPNEYRRGRR